MFWRVLLIVLSIFAHVPFAKACTVYPQTYYLQGGDARSYKLKSRRKLISEDYPDFRHFKGTVISVKKNPDRSLVARGLDRIARIKVENQLDGQSKLPDILTVYVEDGRPCCRCGHHLIPHTTGVFGVFSFEPGKKTLIVDFGVRGED